MTGTAVTGTAMTGGRTALVVRLLAAAGLAVSAYVHLDLARTYDGIGAQLTVGDLFRAQGVAAALAAVAVLLVRRRVVLLLALLVALASTAAVVGSVYVRIPPLGALPELYEPVWYTAKTVSALGTAAAAVLTLLLLLPYRRR